MIAARFRNPLLAGVASLLATIPVDFLACASSAPPPTCSGNLVQIPLIEVVDRATGADICDAIVQIVPSGAIAGRTGTSDSCEYAVSFSGDAPAPNGSFAISVTAPGYDGVNVPGVPITLSPCSGPEPVPPRCPECEVELSKHDAG